MLLDEDGNPLMNEESGSYLFDESFSTPDTPANRTVTIAAEERTLDV